MDDPDQTIMLPVAETRAAQRGITSRRPSAFWDAIIPPKNPAGSHGPAAVEPGPWRFEPTVFGAVRRYRALVITVAVLAVVAAVGYSLLQSKVYQTTANVTVPLPVSSSVAQADPGQYLDSRVLLLESQGVAQRAARIADRQLGGGRLDAANFASAGNGGSLAVSPPATATPGGYGASIIAVSFTGPSPEVSRAGLNALLQAFREAVTANIRTQVNATVAGLDQAIRQTSSPSQKAALVNQRTQAVVNEQTDLGRAPTAAIGPTTRANGQWARNGAIGLIVGIILGAALAFALALRRRAIGDRQDPAAIYGLPMIAEIPAFKVKRSRKAKDMPGGGRLPVAADPGSAAAESFRFAAGSVERICAARRLSLAVVSPLADAGKSTLVANLALAMAEGGTRLLVMDADVAADGLTARLLPGVQVTDGFEQALDGWRSLADCLRTSPLNSAVSVLAAGPPPTRHLTGAARSRAVSALLAEAKSRFDIVLIDSPALLRVADAAELVSAADAAVIVVNPSDRIADHLEMADRLKQSKTDVVGYLYNRAPARPYAAHHGGPQVRPVPGMRPSLLTAQSRDDESRPASRPRPR